MATNQKNVGIRQKECWLELLRIIAIVGVIFNHTDGFYLYYSNTNSRLTFAYSVLASLFCRMSVPLFLMISGSILLEKKESLPVLYKKRVFRIAVILFFTSFFYYILQVLRGTRTEYSLSNFVREVIAGNIQESLWYLYLYLGILLLLPVLRKLASVLSRQEYMYFVMLQCAFSTVFPVLERLFDFSVQGEIYLFNLYLFYFLSGYWWSHGMYKDDTKLCCAGKKWSTSLFFASYAIGIGIILEQYCVSGAYDQSLLDLMISIMAQSFFVWIKNTEKRYPLSERGRSVILKMGSCTFGIYLLEQAVRIQLLPMYLKLCAMLPGAAACSIYVAGTFAVALCYTLVLKKVPVIRNFI